MVHLIVPLDRQVPPMHTLPSPINSPNTQSTFQGGRGFPVEHGNSKVYLANQKVMQGIKDLHSPVGFAQGFTDIPCTNV